MSIYVTFTTLECGEFLFFNGLFDASMKTLETIEHAEIKFFILIISVPHVSSTDV